VVENRQHERHELVLRRDVVLEFRKQRDRFVQLRAMPRRFTGLL